MKFSDINGKKVINKTDGEDLGILTYVHIGISEYTAKALGAVKGEHIGVYSFENSVIGDAVFVDNECSATENTAPLFVGEKVYDINANLIGEVSDFFITNYKITTLFINGEKIPCANVLTFGKDCLIIKSRTRLSKMLRNEINSKTLKSEVPQKETKNDKIFESEKTANYDIILEKKEDIKNIEESENINIKDINNREVEYIQVNESENIIETNFLNEQDEKPAYSETPIIYSYKKEPPIMINDYNFLLGKRLSRDVYDLTNTFIAKKGSLINSSVIFNAKKFGKIVDLALSAI